MTEAQWEAAVRLASGKRLLTQCLFDFRYLGGDRPGSLDLLPRADASMPGEGVGSGSRPHGPTISTSRSASLPTAAGSEAVLEPTSRQGAGTAETGSAASAAGSEGSEPPDGVMAELFDLLRSAGVAIKEEPDQQCDQQSQVLQQRLASGSQQPASLTQAAEAARRADLAAQAEAALSAVREVPGGPPPGVSLTDEAEQRQRAQLLGAQPAGPARTATSVASLLPASGAWGGARVPANVQREIERALPQRGAIFERHGAAGTTTDQRRESPIVEVRAVHLCV